VTGSTPGSATAAGHQRFATRVDEPVDRIQALRQQTKRQADPLAELLGGQPRRPDRKPVRLQDPRAGGYRKGLTRWLWLLPVACSGLLREGCCESGSHTRPPRGLAAGQATQVVSHGRHHHNRLSLVSVPSFKGLNAPAGSPQNRHSGPPPAGPSTHPVVLPVAACIPSNLGLRFTLVLHDRLLCPDEPRLPATHGLARPYPADVAARLSPGDKPVARGRRPGAAAWTLLTSLAAAMSTRTPSRPAAREVPGRTTLPELGSLVFRVAGLSRASPRVG
jgi:hypothetical protein